MVSYPLSLTVMLIEMAAGFSSFQIDPKGQVTVASRTTRKAMRNAAGKAHHNLTADVDKGGSRLMKYKREKASANLIEEEAQRAAHAGHNGDVPSSKLMRHRSNDVGAQLDQSDHTDNIACGTLLKKKECSPRPDCQWTGKACVDFYLYGPAGSNECPLGYAGIFEICECQDALDTLAKAGQGASIRVPIGTNASNLKSKREEDRPQGCFWGNVTKEFFFNRNDGEPENDIHPKTWPLCQREYVLGTKGKNDCPPGYGNILVPAECGTAALVLNQTVGNMNIKRKYENTRPRGCFYGGVNKKVFFNPNSDDPTRIDDHTTPICEKVRATCPDDDGAQ